MESLHHSAPRSTSRRIESLDVLRGFAVLAIFVTNIKMMANGFSYYRDATLWDTALGTSIAYAQGVLIDGKFVTIFTALFGAGLAMLVEKNSGLPVLVRRLFWLAVFGTLHMLLLREGDILLWYALVGFLALPFARLRAPTLMCVGTLVVLVAYSYYEFFPFEDSDAPILWRPGAEQHLAVADIMLGDFGGILAARLAAARFYMLDLFALGGVWIDTLGVMLLGMALQKGGFLSGRLPVKIYAAAAAVGLSLAALRYGVYASEFFRESPPALLYVVARAHRFAAALAWVCVLILLLRMGLPMTSLRAAGRLAFTIYILQSVAGMVLFSSIGLGLFGQLPLETLLVIALVLCVGFAAGARLWLRRYRFGPLEWVWRSLTYCERQQMTHQTSIVRAE